MKKIDKYFWTKSDPRVNIAYCYSRWYNNLQVIDKHVMFNLRIFYKL